MRISWAPGATSGRTALWPIPDQSRKIKFAALNNGVKPIQAGQAKSPRPVFRVGLWALLPCLLFGGCRGKDAGAQGRGVLTVMLTEAPRGMDPANHTATLTGTVLAPMYEGLVRISGGAPEPLLATGWTQSSDGLDWTFRLRPGVRFHDGASMDAHSVVLSFHRLIDPASPLAAAGKFRPVIASVQALDERTVRFHLAKPYVDFLVLLGANQAAIVSPKAVRAGTIATAADGTGPFRFVAWRPNVSVIEARNHDYWGIAPSLRTIRWLSSAEPSVLNMALRNGLADVAGPLSPVFASRVTTDSALRLIHQPGHAFFWIALDTHLPPWGDPRVRLALSYATDRPGLVSALLSGFGQPASAPLADATPYVSRDPEHVRYDLAKARQLLAASGRASGFRIAVAIQDSDEGPAEALQAMWAKAGVDLEIRRLEGGVYAATAFAGPKEKARQGVGGVLASWSSGVVPELQLRPLFASVNQAPAGANLGFFADPVVDRMLDQAEAVQSSDERGRLYHDIQARIVEDSPDVFLFTRDDLVGLRRGVSGVTIAPDGVILVARAAKP
jgi:glutathione transport system substrate-binding protein